MGALMTESERFVVVRRYVIVWWTLATMLAVGVAAFVAEAIGYQRGIVEGLVAGLVVGCVQWAMLLLVGERLHLWPLLTVVGWGLVGAMVDQWPVWAGPWIAMFQWIALRRFGRDAGWWVAASAGGWFVTWLLEQVVRTNVTRGLRANIASAMLGPDASTSLPFYLITALNWTLGAVAYGLVTAFALALILEPGE